MSLGDPLLRARGVARRFGAQVALEPTGIDVCGGEALALIGPNGAGKSTLQRSCEQGERLVGLGVAFGGLARVATRRLLA